MLCVRVCVVCVCARAFAQLYGCMHASEDKSLQTPTGRQTNKNTPHKSFKTHPFELTQACKDKNMHTSMRGARDQARPSGEKGRTPLSTPARFPRDMIPTFTPSTSSRNCPTTNLPPTTPIEPVSVPGCATIADAGALKKYLCVPCVRAHRSCCTYTCMRACVHASVSRTHVPQNINMWRREAT